jgi:hypothetical protein
MYADTFSFNRALNSRFKAQTLAPRSAEMDWDELV